MRTIVWFCLFLVMVIGGHALHISIYDVWIIAILIFLSMMSIDYFLNYATEFQGRRTAILLLIIISVFFAFVSGWTIGRNESIMSSLVAVLGFLIIVAWLSAVMHLLWWKNKNYNKK